MPRALRPREKRLSRDGTFLSIPTLSPVDHVHPSRDSTFLSIPTLSLVGHVHKTRHITVLFFPSPPPVGHVRGGRNLEKSYAFKYGPRIRAFSGGKSFSYKVSFRK
jgi:hypothetical protein